MGIVLDHCFELLPGFVFGACECVRASQLEKDGWVPWIRLSQPLHVSKRHEVVGSLGRIQKQDGMCLQRLGV